jgi:hypothetical protein
MSVKMATPPFSLVFLAQERPHFLPALTGHSLGMMNTVGATMEFSILRMAVMQKPSILAVS